jgi:hypothetical protein
MALGAVVLVAGLGIGIPTLLLSGDHDEYGAVPIPGEATLELPADEVIVFYQEGIHTNLDTQAFPEPEVEYEVRPAGGGESLRLDGDGGREVGSHPGLTWTDIEGLEVPRAGSYAVSARSVSKSDPVQPELSFGTAKGGSGSRLIWVGAVGGPGLFLAGVFLLVFSRLRRAGQAMSAMRQWQASAMQQGQASATGGAWPLPAMPGTAVINSVSDTGTTRDENPVLELDLTVTVPGREPYRVKHREAVSPATARALQPGTTKTVRVDVQDPQKLTLD